MGYYMNMTDQVFEIKAENKEKALEAIKKMAETVDENGGGGSSTGEKWYSWVDTDDFVNAQTLEDALKAWRWQAESDENGNINYLYFSGEKLGDDAQLWSAVGPYVEAESYIQMTGEDGYTWRWTFDGEQMIEVEPKVIW